MVLALPQEARPLEVLVQVRVLAQVSAQDRVLVQARQEVQAPLLEALVRVLAQDQVQVQDQALEALLGLALPQGVLLVVLVLDLGAQLALGLA